MLKVAPPPGSYQSCCWRERPNGLLTLARGGETGRRRESGPSVSSTLKDPVKAFAVGLVLMSACAGLSACNDVGATPPSADASAQFAMRDDANMAGATVAIASVDGAPADVSTRFRQSLDEAAAARRIAVASASQGAVPRARLCHRFADRGRSGGRYRLGRVHVGQKTRPSGSATRSRSGAPATTPGR